MIAVERRIECNVLAMDDLPRMGERVVLVNSLWRVVCVCV